MFSGVSNSIAALVLPCLLLAGTGLEAQALDEITVKDGSRIVGEIKQMTDGQMTVNTAFGGDVKVNWSEVKSIKTAKPLPFVLKDGTQLIGVAQEGKEGTLDIKTAAILQPTTVALDAITAINPPEKKSITYKGHLGLGLSISDGNTHNKSFSFLGDFEARSERQRLALSGAYNYAQNQTDVTQRNGKAELKYDFFITKRLFVFASSLFEYDFFQDLNLRSVLGAGPGFQVIDKGDFAEDYRKEMQLYGEAGLAYFSEDHRNAADDQFLAARWAIKFDWPVAPQKVAFFHKHEGFPSLESAKDLYITTEQGVRLSVWGNFVATLQVNWRWDNTPAPGFSRSDTLYLITLGYSFEL